VVDDKLVVSGAVLSGLVLGAARPATFVLVVLAQVVALIVGHRCGGRWFRRPGGRAGETPDASPVAMRAARMRVGGPFGRLRRIILAPSPVIGTHPCDHFGVVGNAE
jgi:hypothetical protein